MENQHTRSKYANMEVMPSREATKLFREGKITEEELMEIRKINKRKYEYTEKGETRRQKSQEKERNNPELLARRRERGRRHYWNHREEILKKQKEVRDKKKLETLES